MARIQMVTRTIKTTQATIMVVNTESKSVEEIIVEVPRVHEDDVKLLKLIETEQMVQAHLKPVSVVKKEIKEQLYGMEECVFIQCAAVITKESK